MVSPYQLMQMAVDAIPQSQHPTSKVAATLSLPSNDENHVVTATNYWPSFIAERIGKDTRIGNSSGTIHAETACILKAAISKDANLFITDPPCPNCAKNIAEAGIKNLYIDHKGFLKDFAQRRGDDFKNMSMRVFDAAGIQVFEIYRKEEKIIPVNHVAENYVPVSEFPVQIYASDQDFSAAIQQANDHYKDEPFALCLASSMDYKTYVLHAQRHPTIGFTHLDDLTKEGKYSFILQPANRLLMAARFYGLIIHPDDVYSSRIPTSREFVNMVGAGIEEITLGDTEEARDEFCAKALSQLEDAKIMKLANPS